MLTFHSFYVFISALLGLVLAVPSNSCIVMATLETIRKKVRLSPSDVIFLAKGIVNILLQALMALHGISFVFYFEILYIRGLRIFFIVSTFFLLYFSFWLTAWLSIHYCTSIINLNYRVFIWLKRIVANFLTRALLLTALGMSSLSVLTMWIENPGSHVQSSKNGSVKVLVPSIRLNAWHLHFISATFLGSLLPFCLSLLCLLLTFSFLVRHVWRVKNNDSVSVRPKLQAHVTALRTIFFLLLTSISSSMSQIVLFFGHSSSLTDTIGLVNWTLRLLSPSAEAAIIFQASNKLRSIILRRFWSRSWRNTET